MLKKRKDKESNINMPKIMPKSMNGKQKDEPKARSREKKLKSNNGTKVMGNPLKMDMFWTTIYLVVGFCKSCSYYYGVYPAQCLSSCQYSYSYPLYYSSYNNECLNSCYSSQPFFVPGIYTCYYGCPSSHPFYTVSTSSPRQCYTSCPSPWLHQEGNICHSSSCPSHLYTSSDYICRSSCLSSQYIIQYDSGFKVCADTCPPQGPVADAKVNIPSFTDGKFYCTKNCTANNPYYNFDTKSCFSASNCQAMGYYYYNDVSGNPQECLSPKDCRDKGLVLYRTEKICKRECDSTDYFLEETSECIESNECLKRGYLTEEYDSTDERTWIKRCVSYETCRESKRFIDQYSRACLGSCPTYHDPDTKLCLTDVVCKERGDLVETTRNLCLSPEKCREMGKFEIKSTRSCLSTQGSDYLLKDSNVVVTSADCKLYNFTFVSEEHQLCLSKDQCISMGHLVVEHDTSTSHPEEYSCVTTCPANHPYKIPSQSSCVTQARCTSLGLFYNGDTDHENLCLTSYETDKRGYHPDIASKVFYLGCPSNRPYSSLSGKECFTATECQYTRYYLSGLEMCLKPIECIQKGFFLYLGPDSLIKICEKTCTGKSHQYHSLPTNHCYQTCPRSLFHLEENENFKECVTEKECKLKRSFRVIKDTTNKCVKECPSSHPLYIKALEECVSVSKCTFPYIPNVEAGLCIIGDTCSGKGLLTKTDGTCVESCPSSDTSNAYHVVSESQCLSEADCQNDPFLFAQKETLKCYTQEECVLGGFFFSRDTGDCSVNCDSGFLIKETSQCATSNECYSLLDYYRDNDRSLCVSKEECIRSGKKVLESTSRLCLTSCQEDSSTTYEMVPLNECISSSNCGDNLYKDDINKRCLTLEACHSIGYFTQNDDNQCVIQCQSSFLAIYGTQRCISTTDCRGNYYKSSDTCFSKVQCIEQGMFLYTSSSDVNECVQGCEGYGYLRKDTMQCVDSSDCVNNLIQDDSDGTCITKLECVKKGFVIDGSKCQPMCSTGYAGGDDRVCITAGSCANPFLNDADDTECVTQEQCSEKGKYSNVNGNECVFDCPAGSYREEISKKCFSSSQCSGNFVKDDQQDTCITQEECLSSGRMLEITSSDTCVSSCPVGYEYLRESDRRCVSSAQCVFPFFKIESTKRCVSMGQCTSQGLYYSPNTNLCVASCQEDASNPLNFYPSKRCFPTSACASSQGRYIDSSNNQCVKEKDCISRGKYLDDTNSQCVSTCPTATPNLEIYSSKCLDGVACLVGERVIDDEDNVCFLKKDCINNGKKILRSENICRALCPASGRMYESINKEECISLSECLLVGVIDESTTSCRFVEDCLVSGKYIDSTNQKCVATCEALEYLQTSTGRCVAASTCTINYLQYDKLDGGGAVIERTCLTKQQCFESGRVMIQAEHKCIESCPLSSTGSTYNYYVQNTRNCVSLSQCTDNLFIDTELSLCVTLDQCTQSQKYYNKNTGQCLLSCSDASYPYLRGSECVSESHCKSMFQFILDSSPKLCVSAAECKDSNRVLVDSTQQCLDQCPTPTSATEVEEYLVESTRKCIKLSDCYSYGFKMLSSGIKVCVTTQECLALFRLTSIEQGGDKLCVGECSESTNTVTFGSTCVLAADCQLEGYVDYEDNVCLSKTACLEKQKYLVDSPRSCVTTCPDSGTNYLKQSTGECVSEASCDSSNGFYRQRDLVTCLTQKECIESSSYFYQSGSLCLNSCSETATLTYLRESSRECIDEADCNGKFFKIPETSTCVTALECFDIPALLLRGGADTCLDTCPDTGSTLAKDGECVEEAQCVEPYAINEGLCEARSQCSASGKYYLESTNSCVNTCIGLTESYLEVSTNRCVEECGEFFYEFSISPTEKHCLTLLECGERYTYEKEVGGVNKKFCVDLCIGTGNEFLLEVEQRCLVEADCEATFYKDSRSVEKRCLRREECVNTGGFIMEADRECLVQCPGTGASYIKLVDTECIPEASCTAPFIKEKSLSYCITVEECKNFGKFYIEADQECKDSCPSDYPLMDFKDLECINSATCLAKNYLERDTDSTCIQREACLSAGNYFVRDTNKCVRECPATHSYILEFTKECVTTCPDSLDYLFTKSYTDDTGAVQSFEKKTCVTIGDCLERGNSIITSLNLCLDTCVGNADGFTYKKYSNDECIQETDCIGPLLYKLEAESTCLTRPECTVTFNSFTIESDFKCVKLCPSGDTEARLVLSGINRCVSDTECVALDYILDIENLRCITENECYLSSRFTYEDPSTGIITCHSACPSVTVSSGTEQTILNVVTNKCILEENCNGLYIKDEEVTPTICITKSFCKIIGRYLVRSLNICSSVCETHDPANPDFTKEIYLRLDTNECLKKDDCVKVGITDDDRLLCVSRENCIGITKFIDPASKSCIKECPDAPSTIIYLSVDKTSCIDDATCKLEGYLDETREICITKEECLLDSRFIIRESRVCVDECPTGAGEENYISFDGDHCVKESACLVGGLKDEVNTRCITNENCLRSGRFIDYANDKCVLLCPSTHYRRDSTRECIEKTLCIDDFYILEEEKACVSIEECFRKGGFLDNLLGECVRECSGTRNYLNKRLRECYSNTMCQGTLFMDNQDMTCIPPEECLALNKNLNEKTNECLLTCSGTEDYRKVKENKCISSTKCKDEENGFLDEANKECLSKTECLNSGRFLIEDSKTCVKQCSSSTDLTEKSVKNFDETVCITPLECHSIGYIDGEKCVSKLTCMSIFKYTHSYIDGVNTIRECVSNCPTDKNHYVDQEDSECITAAGCSSKNKIIDDFTTSCIPKSKCLAVNSFVQPCISPCPASGETLTGTPLQCLKKCPLTGNNVEKTDSGECITKAECVFPYYFEEIPSSVSICLKREDCLAKGKFVTSVPADPAASPPVSTHHVCTQTCPMVSVTGSLVQTALKLSSGECILPSACDSGLLLYSNGVQSKCFTHQQCKQEGKLLGIAENACYDNCPAGASDTLQYLKEVTNECVAKDKCVGQFVTDEQTNVKLCMRKGQCEDEGQFFDPELGCVLVCAGSNPISKLSSKECIKANECVDPFYLDTTAQECLTRLECEENNKFVGEDNTCLTTCSEGSLLQVDEGRDCYSTASCKALRYHDLADSACYSKENCFSKGHFVDEVERTCDQDCGSKLIWLLTSECIASDNCLRPMLKDLEDSREYCLSEEQCLERGKLVLKDNYQCVSSCPSDRKYLRNSTKECFDETQCKGKLFRDEDLSLCLTAQECVAMGKYYDYSSSQCLSTCTGDAPFLDFKTKECVSCGGNKLSFDDENDRPILCITQEECLEFESFIVIELNKCVKDCQTEATNQYLETSNGICLSDCRPELYKDVDRKLCLTEYECHQRSSMIMEVKTESLGVTTVQRSCVESCPQGTNEPSFLLTSEQRCVKDEECVGEFYKDSDNFNLCLTSSECFESNKLFNRVLSTCSLTCPSTEPFILESRECVADCPNFMFKSIDPNIAKKSCVTTTECNSIKKFMVPTTKTCEFKCPDSGDILIDQNDEYCVSEEECRKTGYVDSISKRCVTIPQCHASNRFIAPESKSCFGNCLIQTENLRTSDLKYCFTQAGCMSKSNRLVDEDDNMCVSVSECQKDSRFVVYSKSTCVHTCPTTPGEETHLRVNTKECILEADCVGNNFKLTTDGKSFCLLESECSELGRHALIKSTGEALCVDSCPHDADHKFLLKENNMCLSDDQCSGFLFKDPRANVCLTKKQCLDSGKVFVFDGSECHFTCPDSSPYLHFQECLNSDQCSGTLYKSVISDTSKKCLNADDCNLHGRYIVKRTSECVATCPLLHSLLDEELGVCVSDFDCQFNSKVSDHRLKKCITSEFCKSTYRYLTPDRTCVPDDCPVAYPYKWEEGFECLDFDLCTGFHGMVVFENTNICLTKERCKERGKFVTRGGNCVDFCSGEYMYLNLETSECFNPQNCKDEGKLMDDEDRRCVSYTECWRTGRFATEYTTKCLDQCPETGEIYLRSTQKICTDDATCVGGGGVKYLTELACVLVEECIAQDYYIIDADDTCVDSCTESPTHIYARPTRNRCATPAECNDLRVEYSDPKLCVTMEECQIVSGFYFNPASGACHSEEWCLENEKLLVPSVGDCSATCPEGRFYEDPPIFSCLTDLECAGKGYFFFQNSTGRFCDTECPEGYYLITLTSECVVQCPAELYTMPDEDVLHCYSTPDECWAKSKDYFIDERSKLCVTQCATLKDFETRYCLKPPECPELADEVNKECFSEIKIDQVSSRTSSEEIPEGEIGVGEEGEEGEQPTLEETATDEDAKKILPASRLNGYGEIQVPLVFQFDINLEELESLIEKIEIVADVRKVRILNELVNTLVEYRINPGENEGEFMLVFSSDLRSDFEVRMTFRLDVGVFRVNTKGKLQNMKFSYPELYVQVPPSENQRFHFWVIYLAGIIYDLTVKVMSVLLPVLFKNPLGHMFALLSQNYDRVAIMGYSKMLVGVTFRNKYLDLFKSSIIEIFRFVIFGRMTSKENESICEKQDYGIVCWFQLPATVVYIIIPALILFIASNFFIFKFKKKKKTKGLNKSKLYKGQKDKNSDTLTKQKVPEYIDNSDSRKRFAIEISKENPNYFFQSGRAKKIINVPEYDIYLDDDKNLKDDFNETVKRDKYGEINEARLRNMKLEEKIKRENMSEIDFIRNKRKRLSSDFSEIGDIQPGVKTNLDIIAEFIKKDLEKNDYGRKKKGGTGMLGGLANLINKKKEEEKKEEEDDDGVVKFVDFADRGEEEKKEEEKVNSDANKSSIQKSEVERRSQSNASKPAFSKKSRSSNPLSKKIVNEEVEAFGVGMAEAKNDFDKAEEVNDEGEDESEFEDAEVQNDDQGINDMEEDQVQDQEDEFNDDLGDEGDFGDEDQNPFEKYQEERDANKKEELKEEKNEVINEQAEEEVNEAGEEVDNNQSPQKPESDESKEKKTEKSESSYGLESYEMYLNSSRQSKRDNGLSVSGVEDSEKSDMGQSQKLKLKISRAIRSNRRRRKSIESSARRRKVPIPRWLYKFMKNGFMSWLTIQPLAAFLSFLGAFTMVTSTVGLVISLMLSILLSLAIATVFFTFWITRLECCQKKIKRKQRQRKVQRSISYLTIFFGKFKRKVLDYLFVSKVDIISEYAFLSTLRDLCITLSVAAFPESYIMQSIAGFAPSLAIVIFLFSKAPFRNEIFQMRTISQNIMFCLLSSMVLMTNVFPIPSVIGNHVVLYLVVMMFLIDLGTGVYMFSRIWKRKNDITARWKRKMQRAA